MGNGNDEEGVAGIGDTCEGVVPVGNNVRHGIARKLSDLGKVRDSPRQECGQEAENTASFETSGHWRSVDGEDVGDTQHQECHVEGEEEGEEGDCRPQCAEQQNEGEDEPSLQFKRSELLLQTDHQTRRFLGTYEKVEAERIVEVGGARFLKSRDDLETAGRQDDGCADPETTVGRKSGRTEGIANSHFPVGLC